VGIDVQSWDLPHPSPVDPVDLTSREATLLSLPMAAI
jgi:hypothetical protein